MNPGAPGPVLTVEELCVGYGVTSILNGVSFSINPGEFVAVVGPNGCGKTTLTRAVLKSVKPASGSVRLLGNDLEVLSLAEIAGTLAAVFQTVEPVAMTVRDYVLLGRLPFFKRFQFFESAHDRDVASDYMERIGISHLADTLLTQLSGGEMQLAAIARALTREPALLVLDEPTSHLDITHQKRILDLVTGLKHELSLTVLMVLHDLNLAAEYADRLLLLDKTTGSVFSSGIPETVLTRENIETVYRTPVQVRSNPYTGKPLVFLINELNREPES